MHTAAVDAPVTFANEPSGHGEGAEEPCGQ